MTFATWSIRNPIPAILIFGLLTLGGLWGFKHLNIQSFPDLDVPTIIVSLRLPGASPSQLETEVVRKVEDSLATLNGLKHIYTNIMDGAVQMVVEFVLERPLSDALVDVKDAIDRVRMNLPPDLEQPQISKVTVGPGGPTLTYAMSSTSRTEEELSWFVDNTLAKTLLGIRGIGEFSRVGGVQREVQVIVNYEQLNALNVTVADVSRALKRVQQEASGGRGQLGNAEQGVRTIATVQKASDLAALPIPLNNGKFIRLDQVATVKDTIAERTQAALLDGKPAIGFQVFRTKGFDETLIAQKAIQALENIKKDNPDLDIQLVRASVTQTLKKYHDSMEMMYEGAFLTILVIWWFLRDWRTTLIGAIALPLSIIPTFGFMYLMDFSLNTITLLALSVVVGILVDDAIVEVENIARHLHQGKSVYQATVDAVNEIALAVLATTATLVAVFLPTAFMSGIPGLVFKQFGWTAVVAVLVSLLVARLITPMMAAWMLKENPLFHLIEEEKEGKIMHWYLRMAGWCLKHRKTTLLTGILFFIGSLAMIPHLPKGFIPPTDEGFTTISMELPAGSNLATTLSIAEETREIIKQNQYVKRIFITAGTPQAAGRGMMMAGEVRRASMVVLFTDQGSRPKQRDIENQLRAELQKIAGARFTMGGGGPGEKIQIILSSYDAQALKASAQAVERDMRNNLTYLGGLSSTASLERAEIIIKPNPTLAAERGVTTQAIAETLRVALSGDFSVALAKLNLDQRQIDIRVQLHESIRKNLNAISSLRVAGKNGLVPLSSIADISIGSGPLQIDRYDRKRQVTISADLGGHPLGETLAATKKLESIQALPSSVKLVEVGDAEIMVELFTGFAMALLTGILCVYCVLVLLFKDWFQPVTILSAVPLSVGGAFIALLIGRGEIGLPALIGLVMLLGIVTKNSILLVDFAVLGMKEHGLSQTDALLDACRKRARPIMMTTIAMVAGMLPLSMGLGGDGSFRQPMGIAVIGGLITSTALSLLIVPVVFSYIDNLFHRKNNLVVK
jgi:multidrug efflux pump subunit AcrB